MRKLPRSAAETITGSGQSSRTPAPPELEPNPYLPGEVIADRYRLQRELGRGGMGVVWVAHSLVLGVDVALKLIRASAAGPLASRMAREAHAAARLGHPALVRVFDFGWTNRGDPFLVMELVQGETLAALLARESRLPAIRAVQMLLPIADGLRLAHDRSIIHRDIKPENIFLAADSLGRTQPKLLDFGIAKVGQSVDGKLTQFGAVLGSPEYMSPEQALGKEDVDDRTDVWSLCIVLYELVTGTVPFRKPNYNALMHAIINEAPRSAIDYGTGDAALWMVLDRGLSKDREQRWANMTELGEALALWLYEHGVKEDLSGNSIRAVWLDGALSGVKVDIPRSEPPRRAVADEARERSAAVAAAARAARAETLDGAPALTKVAPRRASPTLALGIGAGVLIGGLIAFALLRGSAPQQSASAPAPAPPSVSAVPKPAAPPTEPSKDAARDSLVAPQAPSAPVAARAPTRGTAKVAGGSAPRKASASKRSHDFGF